MIIKVIKIEPSWTESYDYYKVTYSSGKEHEYICHRSRLPQTVKIFLEKHLPTAFINDNQTVWDTEKIQRA